MTWVTVVAFWEVDVGSSSGRSFDLPFSFFVLFFVLFGVDPLLLDRVGVFDLGLGFGITTLFSYA